MLSSSLIYSLLVLGTTALPQAGQPSCSKTVTVTVTANAGVGTQATSSLASIAPPATPSVSPSSTTGGDTSGGSGGSGATSPRPTGTVQATLSSGAGYQADMLYHHNAARHNHQVANLTWDNSCASNALFVANKCIFAHSNPAGVQQGQNIFATTGNLYQATYAVTESWYKGEFQAMAPYYNQSNVPSSVFPKVGHLTQVVWKATTAVGCASVNCPNGMKDSNGNSLPYTKFTVCNYTPQGNFGGQFAVNVLKPLSNTTLGNWYD